MLADPTFWAVQLLNGLQLSMLLFLLSVGLTVIFGLMNFINLAHGSLYALGAFLGHSIAATSGSYWLAFVLAPALVALVGALLYASLISRFRFAGPLAQVLVTFGLIFVLLDVFRYVWGDYALGVPTPAALSGGVILGGQVYPVYRLFIIGLGLGVLALLWLALERTRIGAMIRAGVDNAEMAACLGIDVDRLFFAIFCLGCALAGLAGVVAAPVFSVSPGMGIEMLIPTLMVVVIGGLGSLKGALAGSLTIGMLLTFGQVLAPQFASMLAYGLLAVTLIVRPRGLFPARA
jgi:branched-chain amino acid transport system permease protein